MPLPSAVSDSTPFVKGALDLLPPVADLRRPHELSTRIVDQGKAGGLAARVDLEAQRMRSRPLHRTLEDQREREAPVDRRFALSQEQASSPWTHRVERSLIRIYHKHL
jgi:hypothetical protein